MESYDESKVYEFDKIISGLNTKFTYLLDNIIVCFNDNGCRYLIESHPSKNIVRNVIKEHILTKSISCKKVITIYKRYFENKCGFEILHYTIRYFLN